MDPGRDKGRDKSWGGGVMNHVFVTTNNKHIKSTLELDLATLFFVGKYLVIIDRKHVSIEYFLSATGDKRGAAHSSQLCSEEKHVHVQLTAHNEECATRLTDCNTK